MHTLILTMFIPGHKGAGIHSITVPGFENAELAKLAGAEHEAAIMAAYTQPHLSREDKFITVVSVVQTQEE